MSTVLIINSGSSSLKYQLIDMSSEVPLVTGLVERIGAGDGRITHEGLSGTETHAGEFSDHRAAFRAMLEAIEADGPSLTADPPVVIGHRVVHGGSLFDRATVITPEVEAAIEELAPLAPLHNPANLQGIVAARTTFPGVPQVAAFDTAFHQTLVPPAYTYAIDAEVADRHRVRRYGFHGTSHKYVSAAAAEFLGRPLGELKQIVLHLGNGASACAVDGGVSVETSMGMTPLEGLVMGSRSGDIDPAILLYLSRTAGFDTDRLDELLNRSSGMLGLSGRNDMRDVQRAADGGDAAASLALSVYLHRITHYIGAYWALLGGLDALVFTAGVGENSAPVRSGSVAGLAGLGIRIDPELNAAPSHEARRISAEDSAVAVLVVPTNEELEIARQALVAIG